MTRKILFLAIGVILAVLAILPLTAVAFTWDPFGGDSREGMMARMMDPTDSDNQQADQDRSETHQRMHEMMDAVMREGASDRMHEAAPGSEEMMENMRDMMDGTNGMGGMMDMMGR